MAKRDVGDEAYHEGAGRSTSPDIGNRPRAGQSRPYTSGANARGSNQRPTKGPEPGERSGVGRLDESFKRGGR